MKKRTEKIKGAVTLIDVLGWKVIWQREKKAINILSDLIDMATYQVNDKDFIKDEFGDIKTEVISISDTIALVTKGYSSDTLFYQSELCVNIVNVMLKQGILLRGATSYGEFELEKQNKILVGPAIDEVASWYEACNWIGVIHTPSTKYKFFDVLNHSLYLTSYENVPVKNFGAYETLCVNWPFFWNKNHGGKLSLNNIFSKLMPITPEIALKLENTLKFYDSVANIEHK